MRWVEWALLAFVFLFYCYLYVLTMRVQHLVRERAVSEGVGEVVTIQRLQELVRQELAPLASELRHLDLFLRQLQDLHPDQSHPHRITSPRLITSRLHTLWEMTKNPDVVGVMYRQQQPRRGDK
jgi:hypothetical protein